eukprot:COSAG02_NODE_9789_length_2110_cov_1.538538_1_plen_56_part_00
MRGACAAVNGCSEDGAIVQTKLHLKPTGNGMTLQVSTDNTELDLQSNRSGARGDP